MQSFAVLSLSNNQCKTAVLMAHTKLTREEADALLLSHQGNLQHCLTYLSSSTSLSTISSISLASSSSLATQQSIQKSISTDASASVSSNISSNTSCSPLSLFYDLASLTKTLVTAPLALTYFDLYKDRHKQLGFDNKDNTTNTTNNNTNNTIDTIDTIANAIDNANIMNVTTMTMTKAEGMTVEKLLSHAAGLPPWLAFRCGLPLHKQVRYNYIDIY